jgi:hypothetical protein
MELARRVLFVHFRKSQAHYPCNAIRAIPRCLIRPVEGCCCKRGYAAPVGALKSPDRAGDLALWVLIIESSLPAAFLHQRKHRVNRWCCDFEESPHFLDGSNECIDL